ncbi:MAG: dephospho-CoA kinase [Planctomycetes bacterium]|nr:dephospho-CoA kinase [Planctomycetota bacterium]
MSTVGNKPIIGILGGIGSGKTTVANEFAKLGCAVVDADKIAHKLLNEPAVREKVLGLFGQEISDSTGKIDHRKLAAVVFADADKLSSLNRIIHPLVLKQAEKLIRQYNGQGRVKAIVLDMPLLAEVGWEKRCDRLIFVECEPRLRSERAKKMGVFFDEIKIRENFQISLDNKASVADNTINNNSDFSVLVKQVADIFSNVVDSC